MIRWSAAAAVLAIGLRAATALAAEGSEATGSEPGAGVLAVPPVFVAGGEAWAPPTRDYEKLDWVRTASGEWLRGSLHRVSDGTLHFGSEQLDDLEIAWSDVAELRSPRAHTYRFRDPGSDEDEFVTGTAAMVGGRFRIDTDTDIREFPAAALLGMVAGGERERDYWSFETSVGLSLRSGNTDQTDLTSFGRLRRETALTRGELRYRGSFSELAGTRTANSHRGTFELDTYLTRRLFVTAPTVDLFRDPFQNIALRSTVGGGLGYDLLQAPWIQLDSGAGVFYQRTDFDVASNGDAATADDAGVSLDANLELDPTSGVEWDTSYRIQLVATDFDNTNHNLTSTLSMDFWGPFDLDVTFVWDRTFDPPPDASGEEPARDDLRITVGFAIDL